MVLNLLVIFLSVLLQISAAVIALRIHRGAGRPLAWMLVSGALVLMAARRIYVLDALVVSPFPANLLPNEVVGLAISGLMLAGVILLRRIFQAKEAQAEHLEEARARADSETEKLAAVMEGTPVPLWVAEDPDCLVLRGNRAGAALLHMAPGTNQSMSAPPGGRPEHFHLELEGRELAPEELPIQRAAQRGEEVQDLPLDLVFQDGERRHLRTYATPLRDRTGRIQGAVTAMVDVTGMRRAEDALTKAQKMESLGLMAGGLAHDFNNLFQAMLGNLELAEATVPEDSRAQTYLHRLKTALERASRLSLDLLHCSGGDLRRPESMELGALVAGALVRAGLAVPLDLAPDLPPVLVDPLLIGRVVEGLVTNAFEASAPGDPIQVKTYARKVTPAELGRGHWPDPVPSGAYAVLEVSDQGQGIEAKDLPKIFDPFFSTRDIGRGLGLAAALGITRGHRGGIQVESTPGAGSVFRVHFPLPGSPAAPAPGKGPRPRGRVLLVDDEAALLGVVAEMLVEWFGLETVTASDGQEALEIFSRAPAAFDLVILDATMPRMGGVEAFRAMRALRPDLPGLLCSGYSPPLCREEAVAEGFVGFLKKPFSGAELRDLLRRALGTLAG
jgi:two-component system cell cycle sensor histidine kinase/response regulator CckA